jgi:uncharacterized ion transporter superfamily protein YfcC
MYIMDWILLLVIVLFIADFVKEVRAKSWTRAAISALLIALLLYLARGIFVFWYGKIFGP